MSEERPLEPDWVFGDDEGTEKCFRFEARISGYVYATTEEDARQKIEYGKDYELENIESEEIEEINLDEQ